MSVGKPRRHRSRAREREGGIIPIIKIIHITVQTRNHQSQKSNPIKRKSQFRHPITLRAEGESRRGTPKITTHHSNHSHHSSDNPLQDPDGVERATILALSERQELPRRLGKTGPVGERTKTLSFVFIGRSRYRSQRRYSSNLRIVQPKRKQTDRQTTAQAFPARRTGEGGGVIIPIIKIIHITVQTRSHQSQKSNPIKRKSKFRQRIRGRGGGGGIIPIIKIIQITVQTRNNQSQNQSSNNAHGGEGGSFQSLQSFTSQFRQEANNHKNQTQSSENQSSDNAHNGGGRASFQSLKSLPSQFRQPTLDNQLHTF